MPSVQLFGHTYSLPAVATERFRRLQQQVNAQSQMILEGGRPTSVKFARFSWFKRGHATQLSSGERFQELSLLIQNYEGIVNELRDSQEAYQFFFAQLAAGVRRALDEKRCEMYAIEQERLTSYQEAIAQHDEALKKLAVEDEERLLEGVRLLGQAALLLLKKIALCQQGIARLAEDHELQRHVLIQLVGRLDGHRRAYERRQRIDTIVREVAEMAKVALDFESYMREQLGPLQDLLDKVVEVDGALHSAVNEIEQISHKLLQHDRLLWPADTAAELSPLDQRVLDCLITFQLQKDGLSKIWRRLEQQDGSAEALETELALTPVPTADQESDQEERQAVLTALDNIQTLVDLRLSPLIAGQQNALQTPLPPVEHQLITTPRRERLRSTSAWKKMSTAAAQFRAKIIGPPEQLGLEFVLIEAGTFSMGSAVFSDEQPVHEVRISRPFYLSTYPVSQGQWQDLMGDNPSHFRGEPNRPVENVSWQEVQAFITKLNERVGSLRYRLPTEAEWEYAARAGSAAEYSFGRDSWRLGRYAWYELNAGGKTHPVRQCKPNAWGLYDMHGNVWEWVQDWYAEDYYIQSSPADPQGPPTGTDRVLRGGAWDCTAGDCRSASRHSAEPEEHSRAVGFRLLRKYP